MFKQKFVDFLLENNIDKNLMILNDKKEEMNFKVAISNSIIINTKTLMPVKKHIIEFKSGHTMVYLKQNNDAANNIFLDSICFKSPGSDLIAGTCEKCSLSTLNLCIYNSIYKYGCILVKKERK